MRKFTYILLLLFSLLLTGCQLINSNKVVTVTFDSNGGSEVSSIQVNKGELIEKPSDPIREGFEFDGWYLNDQLFIFTKAIEKDITLIAKWNEVLTYYTVTFVDYDETVLKEEKVLKGQAATPPKNIYRTGFEFIGWSEDYNNITEEKTLKAQYEKLEYYHYIKLESFTNEVYADILIEEEEVIDGLPNLSSDVLEFKGWYYNGKRINNGKRFTYTEDIVLQARIVFDVTLVYDAKNEIKEQVTYDTLDMELSFEKYDNLRIIGWYSNPEFEGEEITEISTSYAGKEIYAKTIAEGMSTAEKQNKINNVISELDTQFKDPINSDKLDLITAKDNINISWKSSNEKVISNNGEINPTATSTTVILTATFVLEGYTQTNEFKLIIGGTGMKDISKRVVASYVYNGTYNRNKVNDYMLDTVDVIYASFALPKEDGSIYMSSSYLSALNDYKDKAQAKGVRVILCLGQEGATYCKNFSIIANNDSLRKKFVDNIISTINKYGFDGVDIDWEYPGYNTGTDVSIDKLAYTNLMRDIYKAVKANNQNHLVTSAIPGGPWGYVRFNLKESVKYLDYVNLMTYDLHCGENGGKTYHHTALYKSSYTYNKCSIDESVDLFVSQGVPKEKIIIGAAFYGRYSTVTTVGNNGLGGIVGEVNGKTNVGTTIRYSSIKSDYLDNLSSTLKYYFDDVAKAPYLYDSEKKIFVTYDDPTSIGYKCDYVKSKNVAGIMYWDNGSDSTGDLIEAINGKLDILKG